MSDEEREDDMNYREQAEEVKNQANDAFQSGNTELAVMYYNQVW